MQPLISVIVPVYNVEAYLPQCLDSLAAQTYRQMEFILVDNDSTDQSLRLCRQYAAHDPRFVVLHQQNLGVSEGRNTGLEHAKGDYIGFADSDDWIEPTMFGDLLACMRQHKVDMVMCGYHEYLKDPQAEPMQKGIEPLPPCGAGEAARQMLRRKGYFTAVWNKLFRRDVIFRGDGYVRFDPSLAVGEDEVWLMQVLRNVHRAAFVPKAMYHWRCRSDSASRKECITPRSLSVLQAKKRIEQMIPTIDASLLPLARSRLLNDCYHLKVFAYREGNQAVCRQVSQEFKRVRTSWLFSDDVPLLRKAKVITMSAMIALHLPHQLVDRVYTMRRQHG